MFWRSSISIDLQPERPTMNDPITALADGQLLQMAADLQVQLERGTGTRPVLYLLNEARKKATEALTKLVEVDASEADAIRALQNEVRLFGDMVEACRSLMEVGKAELRRIHEADREFVADLVENLDEETQRQLGVQPVSID